jgi:flavocytochrome c
MLKAGQGLNSPALARALAENAVETLDWTRDFLGVKFKDRVDHFGGHRLARTHITQRVSGVDIIKPLSAKFHELGGELRLKTLMRELITQSNEGVVGVKLQSGFSLKKGGQGETYKVLVNGGVVMATGGFGADVDFRSVQDPRLGETVDTTNKPTATAEGLKALLRIGAAPVHLSHIQLGPWCSPDERYYGAAPDFICYVSQPHGIWLNMDTGSRFVNELSDRAIRANAILALGKPALALADQTAVDKVGWDLSQALAKGVVRHFDSLAQLADHYGVNRSALENSVSRYNDFQKQQQDADFGKPIPADSRPIAVPPFYAARMWPKVHYTMGGARIDAKDACAGFGGSANTRAVCSRRGHRRGAWRLSPGRQRDHRVPLFWSDGGAYGLETVKGKCIIASTIRSEGNPHARFGNRELYIVIVPKGTFYNFSPVTCFARKD